MNNSNLPSSGSGTSGQPSSLTTHAPKRRLGRGLDALIAPTVHTSAVVPPEVRATDVDGPKTSSPPPRDGSERAEIGSVVDLPITAIAPNSRQPRRTIDRDSLRTLADSIRVAGVMQPIVVRPIHRGAASDDARRYELIAGQRRLQAAVLAGKQMIPAIVREADDRTSAELSLIENIQREDLNPMDRAAAFHRLVADFGLSHQTIAERLGLDRSTISNLLRLNELDDFTAEAVRSGKISLGHAKALLGCADAARRADLVGLVIRSGWSVRRTEQAVLEQARRPSIAPAEHGLPSASTLHRADLARRIGELLGTRVAVEAGRSKGAGRLVIDFFSNEQFEGLLRRIGIADDVLHERS